MPRTKQQGHFQFCIDLGIAADQTGINNHRLHAQLAEETAAIFQRFDIRATWAIPSAPAGRVIPGTLATDPRHEIALLATSEWAGPTASRQSVKRHLDLFFRQALDVGLDVSTLVTADVDVSSSLDLYLKKGIRLVRESPLEPFSRRVRREQTVPRGNVWHVVPTCQFPSPWGFWSRLDSGFLAKKALRRSMVKKSTEHVAIRISDMMRCPRPELIISALDSLLRMVTQLQATRRIQAESLRDAIHRWQPVAAPSPQRSVLRPAA